MIINLRSTSQVNHEERGQHSRSPKESCGCGGSGFLNTKSTKNTKKNLDPEIRKWLRAARRMLGELTGWVSARPFRLSVALLRFVFM